MKPKDLLNWKGTFISGRPREVEMEEIRKDKSQLLCLSCQEEDEGGNERLGSVQTQPSPLSVAGPTSGATVFRASPIIAEEYNNCDRSGDERVYTGTTAEDTMPQYREEMSEIVPLRGEDQWTDSGTGLFRSHKRTLSWAYFFGAMAVSALVFFAVLAVVLEMQAKKAGPFADVTESPTAPPFVPPDQPAVLPNATSVLSNANDLQAILKMAWPIEDIKTKQKKDFISALNSDNQTRVDTIIVPIPLLKQATDEMVVDGMAVGTAARGARAVTERTLQTLGMTTKAGSASAAYSTGPRPTSDECVKRGLVGFTMIRASLKIAQTLNLTKEEARQGIVLVNGTDPNGGFNEFCSENMTYVECNKTEIYRSYDGSCNNLAHGQWGSTYQTYRRILLPDYSNGISGSRVGNNGKALPNPRDITAYVLESDPTEDPSASLYLALWGHFVDHDLASTPQSTGLNGTAIACCIDGKLAAPQHPECLPLAISPNDPFYSSEGQACMNFVRSAPAPICGFGPREQFNQITSYLDASTLYGSTLDELTDIKGRWGFPTAWNLGRLPTSYIDDGRPLPFRSTDLEDGCNTPDKVEQLQFCFKSGDKRVNEYLGITSMNLLWIRQHNLISEKLVAGNPGWDEIRIFEESRRIVIAQIQHITYNEFLPLLLGDGVMKAAGLDLLSNGYYSNYDPEVEGTISDAFVGAAFRLGHSMIQGLIKKVGPQWKNEDYIQIHKLFYDPFPLYQLGQFDAVLRGHAAQSAGRADLHFSKQVTEHLFQPHNNSYGLDLAAIDIQRGRDHGLPGYLEWRKVCKLPLVQSFNDLTGIWPREAVEHVTTIYDQVEDIDLYIGGLAETPVEGGMVGPVFSCLLADQFLRLKMGDRFWYENNVHPKPFTASQLQEIRKTSLARVLCDNADSVRSIQPRVMEQQSEKNPRVSCTGGTIPEPIWTPFTESSKARLKSIANPDPASLEEEFEVDDQEERFEEERGKDVKQFDIYNNKSSSGINLVTTGGELTSSNETSHPWSSEETTVSYPSRVSEVSPENKLTFENSRQGVILSWSKLKRSTSDRHRPKHISKPSP